MKLLKLHFVGNTSDSGIALKRTDVSSYLLEIFLFIRNICQERACEVHVLLSYFKNLLDDKYI